LAYTPDVAVIDTVVLYSLVGALDYVFEDLGIYQ
jgi:hypothetical protein